MLYPATTPIVSSSFEVRRIANETGDGTSIYNTTKSDETRKRHTVANADRTNEHHTAAKVDETCERYRANTD